MTISDFVEVRTDENAYSTISNALPSFAEAMADAGVNQGLSRDLAYKLAAQTMVSLLSTDKSTVHTTLLDNFYLSYFHNHFPTPYSLLSHHAQTKFAVITQNILLFYRLVPEGWFWTLANTLPFSRTTSALQQDRRLRLWGPWKETEWETPWCKQSKRPQIDVNSWGIAEQPRHKKTIKVKSQICGQYIGQNGPGAGVTRSDKFSNTKPQNLFRIKITTIF